MAAVGAIKEGGPLGGSHRKDSSSSAMEHHGEGLLTGCPGGLSPRLSPRPSGGFLCPGCGVRSQTSRPSGCLVPEERQGCSLRTPQASPTQRTQRGVPRAPEPLQSGGGTRGRERSGPQGRGRGVGEGQAAPRPGDSGAPGAWGCQGPLASAPRLWRGGGLPYPLSTKLPQTQKVCSADEAGPAKASCTSPATGRTRPGDAAPTLAHPLELHSLCAWTQSIAPRSTAGEMARRAAGTWPSQGRGQPAVCTPPSAGGG